MDIILCGCKGRMGQAVVDVAKNFRNINIVAGVDTKENFSGEYPIYADINKISENADVIIDFSNPALLNSLLEYSKREKVPAVICTTGFTEAQMKEIEETSKSVPILYSRNMSLGVNLLVELSKIATKILGENFDVEIIEKHHNKKIDAPSGTALMLAEEMSCEMPEKAEFVYDRSKERKPRTKNEIGIHSVRGGTIAGDHDVIFAGNREIVTLSHHAESREIFAVGALRAAEYLSSVQVTGLYTMKDVIKSF